ncbi:acyl-CoA thioesterase [Caldibacillus lycopersici]|uniref:Acyl-CoA thioesterase n=1 Tax=Perspicuibacillus lycopersici TaxID=1325689 RepID=A0AAE3ITZ8_9BACI|nr:thioesterase family protein [Perspicuibacillus lycopersici]MCU9614132.1 acyl-CoA thioesterase [Perspicuibacillus lycopersici]
MKQISYIENIDEWMAGFTFFRPLKVRFMETDMFGHVNNTIAFTYFEFARIEFFKWLGFMQDWVKQENETIPVAADLQCDFINQMYFDDELMIYVKVGKLGNSSVDLHYFVRKKDGTICLTGRGAMVQVNKNTGKAVPWNEAMRAKFLHGKGKEA